MKTAKTAPSGATETCAKNSDLITISRDAITIAMEQIETGIRRQFGWQYKTSSAIDLARLLHDAATTPYTEYPGLLDLLNAYKTLAALFAAARIDDSPEGIAFRKLAALDARGAR